MSARERRSVIATSSPPRPRRGRSARAGRRRVHALRGAATRAPRRRRRRGAARTRARPAGVQRRARRPARTSVVARVVGAREQQLPQLHDARGGRATSGRRRRRARSAPGRCRCWRSPSRGGCAARASAASARTRGGRPRRSSPPRCGRACAAGTPRGRRRTRTTGRRSRGGCRAAGPRRRPRPRRSSPGGARMPSAIGSTWAIDDRAARRRLGALAAALSALRRPRRRRRSWAGRRSRREVSSSIAPGPRVRVGDAVAQRHLDDLDAVAVGEVRSVASVCGCSPALTTKRRGRCGASPGSPAAATAEGPSYTEAFDTGSSVSSQIAVWYSNITCSPPWEISGW